MLQHPFLWKPSNVFQSMKIAVEAFNLTLKKKSDFQVSTLDLRMANMKFINLTDEYFIFLVTKLHVTLNYGTYKCSYQAHNNDSKQNKHGSSDV